MFTGEQHKIAIVTIKLAILAFLNNTKYSFLVQLNIYDFICRYILCSKQASGREKVHLPSPQLRAKVSLYDSVFAFHTMGRIEVSIRKFFL